MVPHICLPLAGVRDRMVPHICRLLADVGRSRLLRIALVFRLVRYLSGSLAGRVCTLVNHRLRRLLNLVTGLLGGATSRMACILYILPNPLILLRRGRGGCSAAATAGGLRGSESRQCSSQYHHLNYFHRSSPYQRFDAGDTPIHCLDLHLEVARREQAVVANIMTLARPCATRTTLTT